MFFMETISITEKSEKLMTVTPEILDYILAEPVHSFASIRYKVSDFKQGQHEHSSNRIIVDTMIVFRNYSPTQRITCSPYPVITGL